MKSDYIKDEHFGKESGSRADQESLESDEGEVGRRS